jgi:hypothetical protein
MWNGFISFSIGTSDRSSANSNETSGFIILSLLDGGWIG